MLTDHTDIIHFEILAENQHIGDTSHKDFLALLLIIKKELEQNTPIKKIKKIIKNSNINQNIKDTLKKLIDEQLAIITEEQSNFNLGLEALAGYTFLESIKLRNETTHKQAIRFMAQAREAIKDNKPINDLIDNEVNKYKKGLDSFYRTQLKKAREYGYDKVDKKLSKNIRGWISVAVLDNRTSAICVALHNKFYTKKEYGSRFNIPNPPPRHPNCRSILLTVWEGTRITDYKGQKIETFLKQNPKIAEGILGKKKYRIFITGKAKIRSFIDIKGKRFFRNDEIIKRLGIKSPKRLQQIEGVNMK